MRKMTGRELESSINQFKSFIVGVNGCIVTLLLFRFETIDVFFFVNFDNVLICCSILFLIT